MDRLVTGLLSNSPSTASVVVLDILGYDGWPAVFALSKVAQGELKCCDVCASVLFGRTKVCLRHRLSHLL